jgi:SAM-dependent methyltransferase
LALDELAKYRDHVEFENFEYDGNFPTDQIIRNVLARLPDRSRILDVGCSTGRILKRLTERHECFGIEPNLAAAAVARARGLNVVTEKQVEAGEIGPFDAILLADVFEHLPEPLELLATLVDALGAGGRLLLITGNADAIRLRDRMGEFWYFRVPDHLHMMGEKHVRWLADRLRVSMPELHRCSHYDLPLALRLKQQLQAFSYDQFRSRPDGVVSRILRMTPVFRRAEKWPSAPALSSTADHFVAVLERH